MSRDAVGTGDDRIVRAAALLSELEALQSRVPRRYGLDEIRKLSSRELDQRLAELECVVEGNRIYAAYVASPKRPSPAVQPDVMVRNSNFQIGSGVIYIGA